MLRIHQSSNVDAAIGYYTKGLSQPDYYTGDQSPGRWGGRAAAQLGLSGEVEPDDFKSLVLNKHPETGEKLNPRSHRNRRVGYDFTFNASKSLSMALEFSRDESVKQDIMQAWNGAIAKTMGEIEQHMQTRDHKGLATKDVETGNIAYASFTHHQSRPVGGVPSPHLHQHVYVFNTTWFDKKERFQAAQFGQIKQDAPYYEAVFHNHLAHALIEKGFSIERTDDRFELKGISRTGIETFSERTKQIEAYIAKNEVANADLKSQVGAKLRDGKDKQYAKDIVAAIWEKRLSVSDRNAIDTLQDDEGGTPPVSPAQALTFALEHELSHKSVVDEKRLLATALKSGVGTVSVASIREAYGDHQVLRARNRQGQIVITTLSVKNEELRMLAHAVDTRGIYRALATEKHTVPEFFNDDQRKAAHGIWNSRNGVTLVEGRAGTGKTTLMKTVIDQLEQEGKGVVSLAPTSAAVEVLKQDGFDQPHTLQRFLVDSSLREDLKGKIIWLDEAGMVGVKDMNRVFEIAKQHECRVILSGDTRQHHSVQRGDAMRLLGKEMHGDILEVGQVQRQKRAPYRKAVEWLSQGKLKHGFNMLEIIGSIKEVPDATRYKKLAGEYVHAVQGGISALVVSPTHKEKQKVTDAIRTALKASGLVDHNERTMTIQKPLHWSNAQKKQASRYEPGQKLQFHQHAMGFKKGERVEVVSTESGNVQVRKDTGDTAWLPLDRTRSFEVYQDASIALAKGDMVRITKSGHSHAAGQSVRLINGMRYRIRGFTDKGDIQLDNGMIISRAYGHIDHGVVTTSHSSQGSTVDKVIIANSSESFGKATSMEQFYVSASRGRHHISIYTDDKKALMDQVSKRSDRMAATELPQNRHGYWRTKMQEAMERMRRLRELYGSHDHRFQDDRINDRGFAH
jgi:conjugative relaxase-like TrwC/TraI family protein